MPGQIRLRWENGVVLLVLFGILLLFSALTPKEDAPRIDYGPGNTCVYVLVSFDRALSRQVFVVAFVAAVTAGFLCMRREIKAAGPGGPITLRGVVLMTPLVLLFLFVLYLLVLGFLSPLCQFRKLTIGPQEVVFTTVCSSWSLPRDAVKRVEIVRERDDIGDDVEFLVQVRVDTSEGQFESLEIPALKPGTPRWGQYEEILARLVAEFHPKATATQRDRGGTNRGGLSEGTRTVAPSYNWRALQQRR